MKPYALLLASLIATFVLRAQIVPAQATNPREPASTQLSPFEAVPGPAQPPPPTVSGPIIEAIEFRGARRLPQSMLRAVIASQVGGVYDLGTLRRDSQALYNTGRFSNIAWETEMSSAGAIVRFVVVERPLIRSIQIQGNDIVSITEILERFKERKVNLTVETLYNDEELGRAAAAIQELAAESGRQHVTVSPSVESAWPHLSVSITFRIAEKQ